MKRKGQGALEYLLLIGGAILVAVIVISILVGLSGSAGTETESAVADAQCAKYGADSAECNLQNGLTAGSSTFSCEYNAALSACRAGPLS